MSTIVSDIITHVQAGEALAVNDAVYINSADSKAYKLNVAVPASSVFFGITKDAAAIDDYIRVVQTGRVKNFTGLTAGAFVYASTTVPGSFQLVEPASTQKVVLGIAKSSTELTINGALGVKPGGEGGGAGLDVFYSQDMEGLADVSDFSTGNNAAFLGGGALAGTLALESVSPISGAKSLKFTQAAGSLNDYVAGPLIDLDLKQQSNEVGFEGYFTYDGLDSDIAFVIYDVTNATVISSALDLIPNAGGATRYSTSVYIPSTCTQIRWGFQVKAANSGAILLIDDVQMSTNPFVYKQLVETNSIMLEGNDGRALTATTESVPFNGTGNGWTSGVDGSTPTNGNYYTVQNDNSIIVIKLSTFFNANTNDSVDMYLNGTSYKRLGQHLTSHSVHQGEYVSKKGEFAAGDKIAFVMSTSGGTLTNNPILHFLNLNEQWESENVLTPQVGDDIVVLGEGNGGTAITAAVTDIDFIEVTDTGNGGGNWNGTQFTVPKDGIYEISGSVYFAAGVATNIRLYKDTSFFKAIGGDAASTTLHHFSYQGEFSAGEVLTIRSAVGGTLSNDTNFHHISINRIGYKSLAAIPVQKTAYIKDVKTSGTAGGPSTTATTHIRILNTVEGDSEIVSLSSNQFTLGPGKYLIDASAPAVAPDQHKLRLYNTTDVSYDIEGNSLYSNSANSSGELAKLSGEIIITSPKTFELRHYITTGKASNGLGTATSQGSEVYTQVKITKLK